MRRLLIISTLCFAPIFTSNLLAKCAVLFDCGKGLDVIILKGHCVDYTFPECVIDCKEIEQNIGWSPEGDPNGHTKIVLDEWTCGSDEYAIYVTSLGSLSWEIDGVYQGELIDLTESQYDLDDNSEGIDIDWTQSCATPTASASVVAVDEDWYTTGKKSRSTIMNEAIEEAKNAPEPVGPFDIYPNPTSGVINIELKPNPVIAGSNTTFRLYDVAGQEVVNRKIFVKQGGGPVKIEIPEGLANGFYSFKMGISGDQQTGKIQLKR